MKRNLLALACAAIVLTTTGTIESGIAQPANTAADTSAVTHSWTGVWQGKLEGMPGVTITLADDSGHLAGTIVFNVVDSKHGKIIAIEPRTILNPHFENGNLSFEVKRILKPHLKGEGAAAETEDDPFDIVQMTIAPTTQGKATLICAKCGAASPTELTKE
jgi:hypothetical protein